MKPWTLLSVAAIALVLGACAEPVPAAKRSYVGYWKSEEMALQISADGQLHYWRRRDNKTTNMSVPIKSFHGNNFEAGLGGMTTMFVVSQPPHEVDGKWKMVVDGVELVKAD